MVGISWGGYFALRSAAYDKRITAAAAYDVMDNGLEVMTNIFPEPIRSAIRLSHKYHWQGVLNKLVSIIRKKSILADWAISQGLHITGTKTPYEFFQSISFHNLALTTELLTQDILLLAGAEDHYIPRNQFYALYDFSYAEIGRMCGCSKAAVHDSIEGVRKKFFKFFR